MLFISTLHLAFKLISNNWQDSITSIISSKQISDALIVHTCGEWKANGHTTSGTYVIDPDGQGGQPPVSVECDMADPPVTIIHHDKEDVVCLSGVVGNGIQY